MKKFAFLLLLLLSGICNSQSVNDYKYVIVPDKFDFLKEANQYNMNTLVKMMFEKYGFVTYLQSENISQEMAMNRCKSLYADVVKSSGFLNTNLTIQLKDCTGQVVYTSEMGQSKEKLHQKAYYEALREASKSFDVLGYAYNGANGEKTMSLTEKAVPVSEAKPVYDNQVFAIATTNGYDVKDNKGRLILKMFKTSQPDNYTAQMETINGVVFKKDNMWFFEYYRNNQLVTEKLNLKF